ncbi:MAG TPA: DUF1800 domain-containing protein [Gemmataceae bacterium]|nr:DUF1800 domain-containing protein [Gemmataceae bacterium]
MTETPSAVRAAKPWAPYVPSEEAPWNLRRVVHLHRRAGFAATWSEIQRDLADGPKASIDRILAGKACSQGVPEGFSKTAALLGDAAAASGDPARLKAWWIYRMLFGPDPLGERLALMWHNHFATSNLKVENLDAMRRQNEGFRELARAPFGELLNRTVHDPALLIWLDAPANRKGHPNENLARELMELFTLGIGPFTEDDVKESAQALTGWTLAEDQFTEIAARHDSGEKTILGRKGRWKGDDVVRMLLEHPATAERLAMRICELLMSEGVVSSTEQHALAQELRDNDLNIGRGVETVLRSEAFFAGRNLGRRVLGPVEFVIGAARALELFEPPSSTLVLAEWAGRLGQDLFYPPNVGGWPAGRAWLTTRSLIGRANYAAALVEGTRVGRPTALDALGLALKHGQGSDLDPVTGFYLQLILGIEPSPAWQKRLTAALGSTNGNKAEAARRMVALVMAMPEAQVN